MSASARRIDFHNIARSGGATICVSALMTSSSMAASAERLR